MLNLLGSEVKCHGAPTLWSEVIIDKSGNNGWFSNTWVAKYNNFIIESLCHANDIFGENII